VDFFDVAPDAFPVLFLVAHNRIETIFQAVDKAVKFMVFHDDASFFSRAGGIVEIFM